MTTNRESGALRYEQLSDAEIEIILSIEQRLCDAQDDAPITNARSRARSADTFLESVNDRHSRILLLDGGRGTGKTSLLLTLINRWNYPHSASELERNAADNPKLDKLIGHPPTHVSVIRNLDFDPLPPRMPVIAGLVQAWRRIAESFDQDSGRDQDCHGEQPTLSELWHSLFRMAATGWAEVPQERSLLDQVLDREQQVQDWLDLPKKWKEFIDAVIECGQCLPGGAKLDRQPVFVVVIDDCDLQVSRVREILPALRLLYHPRVFFLVAAHKPHLLDMLKLDFSGQEARLAERSGASPERGKADDETWSASLAKATFEKVFPKSLRWRLHSLSLREFLAFPSHPAHDGTPPKREGSFYQLLNHLLPEDATSPGAGTFLWSFAHRAENIGLPGIVTYRGAHQLHEFASEKNGRFSCRRRAALEVLAGLFSPLKEEDLVSVSHDGQIVDVGIAGEVAALFRPELVDFAGYDLVVSNRADFSYLGYRQELPVRMTLDRGRSANFTALLVAKALEEKGFPVYAAGLRWDTYLSLAWTEWQLPSAAFGWNRHKHPRPDQLLRQVEEWSSCLHKLRRERYIPERYAYAWLHYQRRWSSELWYDQDVYENSEGYERGWVPELTLEDIKEKSGGSWGEVKRIHRDDYPSMSDDQFRRENREWRDRLLPLLARPEIGFPPEVQQKLANVRLRRRDESLRKLRRRYMTDAIIASAAQKGGNARRIPTDQEVEDAIKIVDDDYASRHGSRGVWGKIEDGVSGSSGDLEEVK